MDLSKKNLTIMFGVHRASVYGTKTAAKIMALTATTKDQVQGSHAIDLTGWQVRPKILDEEFHDYRKLLDNAKVCPPPFTLPGLPTPEAAPSLSGQKRGGDRLEANDVEDMGSSCSGTRPGHPSPPLGQEEVEPPLPPIAQTAIAVISREADMAAILEALPDSTKMRVDHITALLGLLLEDPLRSTAQHLLYKSYTPEDSTYIWSI